MPLFGKKHLQKEAVPTDAKEMKKASAKKETAKKKEVAVAKTAPQAATKGTKAPVAGSVIKRPRITEKAALLAEKGIYVFEVAVDTNAYEIAKAVRATYKVSPVKVSTVRIPAKAMVARGRRGSTSVGKKAYVHLKKGDKIELI